MLQSPNQNTTPNHQLGYIQHPASVRVAQYIIMLYYNLSGQYTMSREGPNYTLAAVQSEG